ncbi:MAG: type II toxin-antitoxin system VapC family toxin [Alkalispirochaeta sp.]
MGTVTVLLDTHVLLWWWGQPDRLSPRVLAMLRDPETVVRVSAASAWEIATKYRIGKLPSGATIVKSWEERIGLDGFRELSMTPRHALRAGTLPGLHRDPFDRMLAAQSILEEISVVSSDEALSALGAARIWE